MKPREINLQESISKFLEGHDIYPFSVFCTFSQADGMASITVYLNTELDEILDLLDYSSQCDKSGYIIFPETNTIVLTGLGLLKLNSKLG